MKAQTIPNGPILTVALKQSGAMPLLPVSV
jgi:coatomer protein complex subunit alpha (xenin)